MLGFLLCSITFFHLKSYNNSELLCRHFQHLSSLSSLPFPPCFLLFTLHLSLFLSLDKQWNMNLLALTSYGKNKKNSLSLFKAYPPASLSSSHYYYHHFREQCQCHLCRKIHHFCLFYVSFSSSP